ncbi:MAG TPA: glycosyltransferase, partial [Gaiellaceae bacterium]|nr:glycosyltransferase [Gaiellaceae bacterium]
MPGCPWLVLPTFNEAENLDRVVDAARRTLGSAAPDGFRVLVVDDDSPDGTGAIADRLAAAHPGEVEVLHRAERTGLAPAYMAGFGRALDAGAGFVCEMDADLSHDPADLPRLLEAARGGAGLALGSRYVDGGGIADW